MSQIIPPISRALQAMVSGFTEANKAVNKEEAQSFLAELTTLLGHTGEFKKKLSELDATLDKFPAFEPLYHYLFDLLMLSFIATDTAHLDEDYLESEEWMKIEDETSDKGSELLNLYIYLQEVVAEEIDINLDDYLKEFLLADDDLYQDDFFIYEEIIKTEDIEEAGIDDILKMAQSIESPELEEVFVPLLAFFNQNEDRNTTERAIKGAEGAALNLALYRTMLAFYDGLTED